MYFLNKHQNTRTETLRARTLPRTVIIIIKHRSGTLSFPKIPKSHKRHHSRPKATVYRMEALDNRKALDKTHAKKPSRGRNIPLADYPAEATNQRVHQAREAKL